MPANDYGLTRTPEGLWTWSRQVESEGLTLAEAKREAEERNDDERTQRITDAGADVSVALRNLLRAVDGDEVQAGEVLYECQKVATATWEDKDARGPFVFIARWKSDDYEWNAQPFGTPDSIVRFFASDPEGEQERRIREACEFAVSHPGAETTVEGEDDFTITHQEVV